MPIVTPLLSYLQNPDKILPVAAIEVPTTLGRTYQGYKRGGKTEARERLCEESLGAVIWLFGVKAFNKIGDFFGEKVLGLKELSCDVGKDSLRRPFDNVTHKKGLTAGFKFTKILASAVLGTLTMGMIVPKLKMAMTNAFRMKDGLEPIPDKNSKDGKFHKTWADNFVGLFIKNDYPIGKKQSLNPQIPTIDKFKKDINLSSPLSFKGMTDFMLYASHNLENNTAWRLLSTDVGTLAGRIANSRNKTEATEYLVRDSISSWFYIFAAPTFASMVRKLTKTSDINPKGAEQTAIHLKNILLSEGKNSADNNFFSSKFLSKEKVLKLIDEITFDKDDTITLEEFNKQTKGAFDKKASLMSKLQPMLKDKNGNYYSILSKKQAVDIMSDSYTSDPEFLKKAISSATNGKSDDPMAFVSRGKLESIRESFDNFVYALEKYAKKKSPSSEITPEIIDKFTKYINRKNLIIHLSGMAFAAFGLSYLIPKLQYYITEKTTGSKQFPGTMGYENETDNKAINKKPIK